MGITSGDAVSLSKAQANLFELAEQVKGAVGKFSPKTAKITWL